MRAKLILGVVMMCTAFPALAVDETDAPAPDSNPTDSAEAPVSSAPPPASEKARSSSRIVEEIIVTAQKREENLQDVPVSVQAFSAETLDARGITDQSGLMRSTPSLDVATQTGFTTLFLRGVGTEAFLTADPSVASYIDGVYYPFTPSIVQDFGAVERVEVLKGPQGTLFGRNAIAGAINTVTTDPDFEEHETSLQAGYSSFDTYKSRIYTNVPITDQLAANASILYSSGDSYLSNDSSVNGQPLYRETHKGARVKLRYAPADVLDFVLAGTYLEDNDNASLPSNFYVTPLGRSLGVQAAEGRRVQVDQPLYRHFKSYVVSGQGTYNSPLFDVKLIASNQTHEQDYIYDFDGSVRPLVSFAIGPRGDNGGLFADIQEGELQIVSNEDSFGADWLKFNAGVFYFKGRSGLDPIRATVSNITAGSLAAYGAPSGLLDAINAIQLPPGLELPVQGGGPLYSLLANSYTQTESLSEYIQITVKMTDWASLTLGGRYQNEERSVPKSTVSVELRDGTAFEAFDWQQGRDQNGVLIPLTNTTKGFQPKATLDLHPFGDDTLVYLTYQEAVKSATYNSFALYLPPEFVKPEEMKACEVGLKTSFFDGAMRFTASTWYYDITNLQSQFVSLINGGAVSFENAKKSRSRGVDFDIVTQLFPDSIDGLALTLNGAYVDAIYKSYPKGSGLVPEDEGLGLGIFSFLNDYSGNRNTRSPKFTGSTTLSKTWQMEGGVLETSADYYYNDGYFYTASNDPNFSQDAYQTINARVSYLYEPWQLRATVYGSNLANEFYTTGMIATDFGGNYTVAPGRAAGLRLDWQF